jgi:phage I-like protein
MNKKHPLQFALSAVIDLNGIAPSEFRLLPAGNFRSRDVRPQNAASWLLDAQSAAAIIAQVNARADKLVIDYEHQTLYTEQNGQPAPAAGWFKDLEWREGDGLYAVNVEWTDSGAQKVVSKEYRYISPVFLSEPKTGVVTAIAMAALTNHAGIDGLTDLAALNAHYLLTPTENAMNPELLKLLGLAEGADEAAVLAAVSALKAKTEQTEQELQALSAKKPDLSGLVPVAVVTELQTELAALRADVSGSKIDKLIADNLTKLPTPGLQTWAKTLGYEALSAYLKEAPAVPALEGMQTGGKTPEGAESNALNATTEELEVAKALGMDVADIIKQRG